MELCKISGSAAFQFGHLPKRSVFRMTGTEFKLQNRMFIAGMGFVGQRLGRELKNHGCVIVLDAIKNHMHMVVSIPPVPGMVIRCCIMNKF